MDTDVIIILSDDDEEEKRCYSDSEPHNQSTILNESSVLNDSSVLIVEEVKKAVPDRPMSPSALDEDLVITFSQRAEVLPHARYDCCTHPFIPKDGDSDAPVGSNHLICDQCFCYICDKLASQCTVWCTKGICHCNSHKRSVYWSNLRDKVVLGYLKTFNFSLGEIDTQLRHAESMLIKFEEELRAEYSIFLRGALGVAAEKDSIQTNRRVLHPPHHNYMPVFECVSAFLNQADKEEDRAAAIMRLGATQHFIRHQQPPGIVIATSPQGWVEEAKQMLLHRVLDAVHRQMVMADFNTDFIVKLEDFYKRIPIPPKWRTMRNSLHVRPWEDTLLVSVLKGQNVTGVRKDKYRRDILVESETLVLLRTEKLEQQHRYRELCRYLRVVQTDDSELVQRVRDLIPLFQFKAGDFKDALGRFFVRPFSPACRLSPQLFLIYLRILTTATSPSVAASLVTQLRPLDVQWEPIAGVVAQSRMEVVKFALRVQQVCPAVYNNSMCWSYLLQIVNTPSDSGASLEEPPTAFQKEARGMAQFILGSNIQVPKSFQSVYPDQALLLLVTEALAMRLLSALPLHPVLPVINTFKANVWALQSLCGSLSCHPPVFLSFMEGVTRECANMTDAGSTFPSSRPQIKNLMDHSYCDSPEASKPFPCSLKTVSRWDLPALLWK